MLAICLVFGAWKSSPSTRRPSTSSYGPGRRLVSATVDPDGLLVLESNVLNNTQRVGEAKRDDGLTAPVGDAVEALELAILGGMAL